MVSDEGTASSKPPLTRSKRKASSDTESKKKKPTKVTSIEATVVEMGPEHEQEGSKIRQRIDYYIQY